MEATPYFPVAPTSCLVVPPGRQPDTAWERLGALETMATELQRFAPHALYELFCGPFYVYVKGTVEDMRAIEGHLIDNTDQGDLHFPHPHA